MALFAGACASAPPVARHTAPRVSPTERYKQALAHRLEGNARAYYDGLIALAADSPDSRAGRRARAMLQSGDMMTLIALAGAVGAIGMPNFTKYMASSKQSAAQTELELLHMALQAHHAANGAYCAGLEACGIEWEPGGRYVYFLSTDVAVGGAEVADRDELIRRGRAALEAMGLEPHMDEGGYLIPAIGDLDDDPDLDIWTIDDGSGPVNLMSDVNSPTRL